MKIKAGFSKLHEGTNFFRALLQNAKTLRQTFVYLRREWRFLSPDRYASFGMAPVSDLLNGVDSFSSISREWALWYFLLSLWGPFGMVPLSDKGLCDVGFSSKSRRESSSLRFCRWSFLGMAPLPESGLSVSRLSCRQSFRGLRFCRCSFLGIVPVSEFWFCVVGFSSNSWRESRDLRLNRSLFLGMVPITEEVFDTNVSKLFD